jgi:cold shock protein
VIAQVSNLFSILLNGDPMSKGNSGKVSQQNKIGTVKWFNIAKGYGFISAPPGIETDLFVHYSAIDMDGYKYLKPGQTVNFKVAHGPKGLHAVSITAVHNNECK